MLKFYYYLIFYLFSPDSFKNNMNRLLVVPNATRWNSLYDATKVLLEQTDKLNTLMDHIGEPSFIQEELSYIEEFVDVSLV